MPKPTVDTYTETLYILKTPHYDEAFKDQLKELIRNSGHKPQFDDREKGWVIDEDLIQDAIALTQRFFGEVDTPWTN